jgi:hypothetical protein
LADDISGANKIGAPADLNGNVNVLYADGILVGDHAHYDGSRYIDLTGHPYIANRNDDTILRAATIRFDTLTSKAVLLDGVGQTSQGVETGHLYYKARTLTTNSDGVTHGEHASFTTCDRQRAGYHIEAKTLDVYPGDKAVAHSAVLFLGGFAVFFLPLVVIPLNHVEGGPGRQTGFCRSSATLKPKAFMSKRRSGSRPATRTTGTIASMRRPSSASASATSRSFGARTANAPSTSTSIASKATRGYPIKTTCKSMMTRISRARCGANSASTTKGTTRRAFFSHRATRLRAPSSTPA